MRSAAFAGMVVTRLPPAPFSKGGKADFSLEGLCSSASAPRVGALVSAQMRAQRPPRLPLSSETPHSQLHRRQVPRSTSACPLPALVPIGLGNRRKRVWHLWVIRGCWLTLPKNADAESQHVDDFHSFTVAHDMDFHT